MINLEEPVMRYKTKQIGLSNHAIIIDVLNSADHVTDFPTSFHSKQNHDLSKHKIKEISE